MDVEAGGDEAVARATFEAARVAAWATFHAAEHGQGGE